MGCDIAGFDLGEDEKAEISHIEESPDSLYSWV
jgi:hypothetical protein